MFNLKYYMDRRRFLGGATASAALALAGLGLPRLSAEPANRPARSDSPDFEGWLNKIKGKHRQIFDVPEPNEGMPFAWSRVFLMTNSAVGTPESDLTAVIVLRHEAIPLALDHPAWEKYKLGDVFKITDKATNAPSVRNPFYHPKEGELPLPGMAIEDLMKSGVLFGACDMALTVYSGITAKNMKQDPEEVKKDWVAAVLPGIQIVPSGVLAVNRAQEHGCTYCFAG